MWIWREKSELINKILRRLVDGTSPTDDIKIMTFNAIVHNKQGVDEILAIAIKMVSDNMDDTVNTCK